MSNQNEQSIVTSFCFQNYVENEHNYNDEISSNRYSTSNSDTEPEMQNEENNTFSASDNENTVREPES